MDFELSDDQVALVDTVADLCTGRAPIETVRAAADTDGIDRSIWAELAAMGVFSLPIAEADGGVGLGWTESALVLETLARRLVPGPLIAAALVAGHVPGVADGSVVPALIERPPSGGAMIEHLTAADTLLILDDEGLWQVAPGDVDATPMPIPLDPLTPVASAPALPQGDRIADAAEAARLGLIGATLTAAAHLGLAAGATDLAVAYAMDRHQFGKPIGQFQAVKHMCADMATKVEVARAAVYSAAVTIDDPSVGDLAETASVAAIVAAEAGDFCTKTCVQVHGGMGYTWEVDAHLFLKRAWVLDHSFGTIDDHAEALAARL